MNPGMSEKVTSPSPFISASSKNSPACRMLINAGMAEKFTMPSWFESPNKKSDSNSPGVGATATQLLAMFPLTLKSDE